MFLRVALKSFGEMVSLCLTFIDLEKAFDSLETEAVIEALAKQGIQTQYIRILHELYYEFTTRISPFYKEVIIDVKGSSG